MRMRLGAAVLGLALGLPGLAGAQPAGRPVVAELFTSEGCSSCPPADALLGEIARTRPDVLALAFHVTYWDRLGWRDPFALPAATARQRAYAARLGLGSIYTPQLVVDGARDVVGSDRDSVLAALRGAAAVAASPVPLALVRDGGAVEVRAGDGAGAGEVWLLGFDAEHRTAVARGENAGHVLSEANIVRAIIDLGPWQGRALRWRAPVPVGEHLAALVQAADGRILGAASLP